jgi:FkbM family methyltransferase
MNWISSLSAMRSWPSLLAQLTKPEYIWHPKQIVKRLRFVPSAELSDLPLPWGQTILARTSDIIGRAIATHGIYDLAVTEAIWRLTEPGDVALDIGGNIGYTALLLSLKAGSTGKVTVFEPNPDTIAILQENISRWKSKDLAPIAIERVALSDTEGWASLTTPDETNSGSATLSAHSGRSVTVTTKRIDSFRFGVIDIMKIDVEGHEYKVLAGARSLLSKSAPRDILFEEHADYPSQSHRVLEDYGYQIFRVGRATWRPLLLAPNAHPYPAYMPSNFLATLDCKRAKDAFSARGWLSLRGIR